MLGAGTFISALLRVVTTVAVLAAVYFFIVKPVLETTEKVTHSFSHSPAFESAQRAVRETGVNPKRIQRKIRISVRRTTAHLHTAGLPKQARRTPACIQRANGDVDKIQACSR